VPPPAAGSDIDMVHLAWGLAALLGIWLASAFVSWSFDPSILFRGEDGKSSSSKFQFLLWVATTAFSFVALLSAAFSTGGSQARIELPDEVVAAFALSVATLVSAKAITVAQIANGRTSKPAHRNGSLSALVTDDSGNPDLTKVQMLGWTVIAVTVYLARVVAVVRHLPAHNLQIPALDRSLVMLCGVGYIAYLGKKLVSTDRPRLIGLSPPSGHAPLSVTIIGTGMGTREGASVILDGLPVATFVSFWSDRRIDLTLPSTRPDGTTWPNDRAVSVGLSTGGQLSSNTILFTFH
jgi:hypothetical protein